MSSTEDAVPLKQSDLKYMLSARAVINEVRDDLVAAFSAAGIALSKLEHLSLQGFLEKTAAKKGQAFSLTPLGSYLQCPSPALTW